MTSNLARVVLISTVLAGTAALAQRRRWQPGEHFDIPTGSQSNGARRRSASGYVCDQTIGH